MCGRDKYVSIERQHHLKNYTRSETIYHRW